MQEIPVAELPAGALHEAFIAAFSDYLIGPFKLSLEQFPQFVARQGIDLALSTAMLRDGQVLAFSLVAPRPQLQRWRLGTMGAVPAARGTGAAAQLLDSFVRRAREAGQRVAELEVFAQNERAVRLYRGRGFETVRELYGFQAPALGGDPQAPSAEVARPSREEAFAWLDQQALPRLPDLHLQATPVALSAGVLPLTTWRLGDAQLIYSQLDENTLSIASLLDLDAAQKNARALVQQLRAAHPAQAVRVPQLQRMDLGGRALVDSGFEPMPLHQLLMWHRL